MHMTWTPAGDRQDESDGGSRGGYTGIWYVPMKAPLDKFLARVAAIVWRRELAAAGLWALVSIAIALTLGSFVVGATLRGDLGARLTATVAGLTAGLLLVRALRRTRRLAGSKHRTAHTIAQNRRPLTRRSAASSPLSRADDTLRQEILGAVELTPSLDHPRDRPQRAPLGSLELATLYVQAIAERLRDCEPELAAPPPRLRAPALTLGLVTLAAAILSGTAKFAHGLSLLLLATDGRPPSPPEPLWSVMQLTLIAPAHAARPERVLTNPSGELRLLAGTRVQLALTPRRAFTQLRVTLTHDPEAGLATPPFEHTELKLDPAGIWLGSFVVRSAGSWRLVPDTGGDSPAFSVAIEPDEPPEVDLSPLARSQGDPSERDTVELRFKARDDFGLAQATLVFVGADEEEIRLDAGPPPPGARTWQRTYLWDLSGIPLGDRGELSYWIEVRDNDPGLGLVPLVDPPGKPARSARMRLTIRDEEREHSENLANLVTLRDATVDLLARRMLSEAPDLAPGPPAPLPTASPESAPGLRALRAARELLAASERLLVALRSAIDALSVDALTPPRDIATLTAIHHRLLELHRREAELHAEFPPGSEDRHPLTPVLSRMAAVNREQLAQLEDEIIRLDDLVDDQVVAQIEALVARLQASQQKIVDLLEALKAGDTSVRGEIEQLQQRSREDLRRLAEARARLDKEVGQEFLNVDAFQAMEARMRNQDIGEQLRRGDVDGALDQARDGLEELKKLRDDVQQRRSDQPNRAASMTPQERARMELLRELSRIQDDEVGLRSETRQLHQAWRQQAQAQPLEESLARKVAQKAAALRKELDAVNDARLGRDGRRALDEAREQLQQLEGEAAADPARALPSFEAAQRATQALRRASAGAGETSSERRTLDRVGTQAQRLLDQLGEALPAPDSGLGPAQQAQFQAAQQRQAGLRGRASQLLEGSEASELSEAGKQALRAALDGMQASTGALEQRRGGSAIDAQSEAIAALQRALDSLRETSPSARPAAHSEASTETERDRSLRDELMDAMKEGAPDGFNQEVERYYEELLR